MQSLKQKLLAVRGANTAQTPSASERALREQLLRVQPKFSRAQISDQELAEQLNGICVDCGLIYFETAKPHGITAVKNDDRQLPEFPSELEGAVFFDLETTGLAGGSGTIAFLVGVGSVEDDILRVRQFLLTSYQAETRLLLELEAYFRNARTLISYNGKSFDWPLLQTRRRMQRQAGYHENFFHLDLLFWIRRAFSSRWADCRLQTVERQLLDVRRHNDIASEEIPIVWSDWLRFGQWQELPRVLAHHRQDIESLALVFARIPQIYSVPHLNGADTHAVASYLRKHKQFDFAENVLVADSRLSAKNRLLLADCLKRRGDWAGAVSIWKTLSDDGCATSRLSLSKYYEHRQGDYAKALFYAELLANAESGNNAYQSRLQRLRGKIEDRRFHVPS